MSLFDSLLKAATGASPAIDTSQSSLASAVLSMLSNNQTGGISGLAQQFAAQGLGHIISSWIGPDRTFRSPQSKCTASLDPNRCGQSLRRLAYHQTQ